MMKLLATIIPLLAAGTAFAQEAEPAPEADSTEETVNLLETTEEAGTTEAEAPAAEAPPVAPVSPGIEVTIGLKNGVSLNGTVSQNDLLSWAPGTDLSFTPAGGTLAVLPGTNIATVTQAGATTAAPTVIVNTAAASGYAPEPESNYRSPGGFKHPNPAASRYLYAPSSINMKAGQGYVSQKLVFTSVAYAPTDNFTLLFGTFTPFPPLISVFGGKTSFQISDNVSASIGGEAFILGMDQEIPLAIGFGSLTFGNEDKHFTVATGYGDGSFFDNGGIPLMFAGQWRSSAGVALITENWLIFDPVDLFGGNAGVSLAGHISSVAIRLVGRRDRGDGVSRGMRTRSGHPRTTWDLGFAAFTTRSTNYAYNDATGEQERSDFHSWETLGPLPWIDWTWHFGKGGNQ